jgi:transposase InsO family protein
MTSVWVAEHGWCYPMAAIDCCTREIVGWHPEPRCRARESIALVEHAVAARGVPPGTPTIGTDNRSAFCARAFKLVLAALGVTHRRGGYRDPESQAFIESWFAKLKQRLIWPHEFETLDQAREVIGAYITSYHHRPHSALDHQTPAEVAHTWDDALGNPEAHAARTVNTRGEQATFSVMNVSRPGVSMRRVGAAARHALAAPRPRARTAAWRRSRSPSAR